MTNNNTPNPGVTDPTVCVFCGQPNQQWPGGGGYGHNPEPLCDYEDGRCCDSCNGTLVIGARMLLLEGRRADYAIVQRLADTARAFAKAQAEFNRL